MRDTNSLTRQCASALDYSLPYSAGFGELVKTGKSWLWTTSAGRTLKLTVNQLCFPASFERAFVRQLGLSPWDHRPSQEDWRRFINATPIIDHSERDTPGVHRVQHCGKWHWVVLGQPAKLFPGTAAGKSEAIAYMAKKVKTA